MTTPSVPLGGRYLYKSMVEAGTKAPTWLASDQRTGTVVVAASLDPVRVAALREAVGVQQDHLAAIIEVVDNPDPGATPPGTPEAASVVVADHVGGKTLHEVLSTATLSPTEAVALLIPLCRAVGALHARGGAHGAISPRAVVVDPSDGRPGPVLTQLIAQTRGPYCAPERLQGRGWSAADDTWALHALLFAAITGTPPFPGQTKDELLQSIASGHIRKLADLGVRDAKLEGLIEAGLIANFARRRNGVPQLVEALESWQPPAPPAPREPRPAAPVSGAPEAFGEGPNPFDDEEDATMIMRTTAVADARSLLTSPSEPPPTAVLAPPVAASLPQDTAGAAPVPTAMPTSLAGPVLAEVEVRRPSRNPVWVILGVLVVVAVGAGGALIVTDRGSTAAGPTPAGSNVAGPAAASAVATPSAPAVAASEQPPSASAARPTRPAPTTPEERSKCVAAHFEEGTFGGAEDMGFLCDTSDLRGINSLLHRRLVVAGAGKITPGMREWSTFGWFELAATAVVRADCCPASTPAPNLPRTPGDCPQLSAVLEELGKQPLAKERAPARAAAYDDAVTCLFRNGIPRPYNYMARPTGHARRSFETFFERVAALDRSREH